MIIHEYLLHGLVALLRAKAGGSAPVLSCASPELDGNMPSTLTGRLQLGVHLGRSKMRQCLLGDSLLALAVRHDCQYKQRQMGRPKS